MRSDRAFQLLCELIEAPEGVIHPDGVRYSGEASAYEHLVELGALSPGDGLAAAILCPWCGGGDLHTLRFMHPHYQGYCVDCGWIELAPDQVTPWRVNYPRIAGWLGAALGVAGRYPVQALVPDVLWRLGELEHRRTRYSLFFGRRWCEPPVAAAVDQQLRQRSAPGRGVVISTSTLADDGVLDTQPTVVPLRAVAHLRKAGFQIENLALYLDGVQPVRQADAETSLRLLHSHRSVVISGTRSKVSPQVYDFLRILLEAEGDEVDKLAMAAALEIDTHFRLADLFKRYRHVLDTFIQHDHKGTYWLRPEFLLLDDP